MVTDLPCAFEGVSCSVDEGQHMHVQMRISGRAHRGEELAIRWPVPSVPGSLHYSAPTWTLARPSEALPHQIFNNNTAHLVFNNATQQCLPTRNILPLLQKDSVDV